MGFDNAILYNGDNTRPLFGDESRTIRIVFQAEESFLFACVIKITDFSSMTRPCVCVRALFFLVVVLSSENNYRGGGGVKRVGEITIRGLFSVTSDTMTMGRIWCAVLSRFVSYTMVNYGMVSRQQSLALLVF